MNNNALLDKQDIPVVSLDIMNRVHYEEADIINQLYTLLEQESPNLPATEKQLDLWLQHTIEHFERENHFMEQYHFPAFAIHSSEHQHTLEQMKHHIDLWRQNHNHQKLLNYMKQDWLNWFKSHVASMDMVTARFLAQVMPEHEQT